MKKIFSWFGYVPNKEGLAKYIQSERERALERGSLQAENKELRTALFLEKQKTGLPHPVVGVDVKDPSPTDSQKRKSYVGQVAGVHIDIMKPKLLQMIAETREQFEIIDRNTFGYNQEQYDLFLKGTINGLWLIHDWGESMLNEQLSYQNPDGDGLDDEELGSLKDKINE